MLMEKVERQPDAEWIRAFCPRCGLPVVSNAYYIGGRGYIVRWECWGSLAMAPSCDFRFRLEAGDGDF